MKIYISGRMSGVPNQDEPRFRAAAKEIEDLGHEAVVPHDIAPNQHTGQCPEGYGRYADHTSSCYLITDIIELLKCDAIYLLPTWFDSRGARLELQISAETGKTIIYPGELKQQLSMEDK